MGAKHTAPADGPSPRAGGSTGATPEERLERGEVLYYPTAPFPLPAGADHEFLLEQELGSLAHKNISYDPASGRVTGFVRKGGTQAERLREIFAAFSRSVTAWLTRTFPGYSEGWQLDRCSFRPQEEATRRLRHTARNDLLHVDAFPNRPSQGHRILRVFANINASEPRIWVTSDPFAKLLARYGEACGLPGRHPAGLVRHLAEGVLGLFRPRRSAYDTFMLRFHDYLKLSEEFQEKGPKHLWTFPPGSVWLALTDTCSHSVLRGRYALEHSYFLAPHTLTLPNEHLPVLLDTACAGKTRRAA